MLPPGFSLLSYPPPSAFAASSCAAVVGAVACSAHCAGGLFFSDVSGADQRPRWGRSAGPHFSPMRNGGKNRQRRGLPPPCGIPPAVLDGACAFLFLALELVGSHRWRGCSTENAYSSGRQCFYRQGLTWVSRCSQLSAARLPAAGTPLLQGRPGDGNHLAVGPAAQGGLVWWQD